MGLLDFKMVSETNDSSHKKVLNVEFIGKPANIRSKVDAVAMAFVSVMAIFFVFLMLKAIPSEATRGTFIVSIMVGIPILIWFILMAILFYRISKSKKLLFDLSQGNYRIEEDIITSKYRKPSRYNEPKYCYYITGIKSGADVPQMYDESEWKQSRIGNKFWILEVGSGRTPQRTTYVSSCYELSPEFQAKVESVSNVDVENARRVVQSAIDSGEFRNVPKDEFAHGFLEKKSGIKETNKSDTSEPHEDNRKIIVCGVCGRRFNATKYGNTCPKCGAICMDD